MNAGREYAHQLGIDVMQGERIRAFGSRWLIQSKRGFEPCPWAFDLAHFVPLRRSDRVLDLGCGVAPIMVALSVIEPRLKGVVGIELDEVRVGQAQRNLRLNRMDKALVIRADIRALPIPAAFDLVVANPPFYPMGWGRQSSHEDQLSATHELNGTLQDFIGAARRAMREDGHLVLIYDSSRLETLLRALPSHGLLAKKMRFLEDDRGKASRVLVLAGRGGAGLAVDTHRSMNLG